jgi:hypothetical protein
MAISTAQLLALDLVGPDDIARRLSHKANTVATWRKRYQDFPAPEFVVGRVPVWRWQSIQRWAQLNGRMPEVRSGEITAEDLRDATQLLPTVRKMIAREVREAADQVAHLVATGIAPPPLRETVRTQTGRIASVDGAGNGIGEWDWYWQLSKSERARLRPWFSRRAGALDPDQYAAAMGCDDVEFAMGEWVRATSLITSARMLAHGQRPAWNVDAETTYPLSIFGADGAITLAKALADERERYASWSSDSVEIV